MLVVVTADVSVSSSAKDDLLSDGYEIADELKLPSGFGNIRLTLIRLTSNLEREEYYI